MKLSCAYTINHDCDCVQRQVSSSCTSVYVDGSEIRGSTNATIAIKYGTYEGTAQFIVWMPEFPLDIQLSDPKLSQIKGWRVPNGLRE